MICQEIFITIFTDNYHYNNFRTVAMVTKLMHYYDKRNSYADDELTYSYM